MTSPQRTDRVGNSTHPRARVARIVVRLLGALIASGSLTLLLAGPAQALPTPSLSSTASGATTVGLDVFDNVNLTGGSAPTGSVTFRLFGPNDPGCAGTEAFSSTVSVSGNGSYNSAHFATTAAGTYQWVASYSGDANNNPVAPTSCADPNESVIVGKFQAGLSTTASPTVATGGKIHDTATLNGRAPTGTISFSLSGPADQFCGAVPVFTGTAQVNAGSGSYDSPDFTPTTPGTYRWQASYAGDANNQAVLISGCLEPAEAVVVTAGGGQATPVIATSASPSVALGGVISDTAVLSGGSSPTGKIAFAVFGPNDASCTGTPAFSSMVTVSGNASYSSGPFTPTVAGTYRFAASYGGDGANAAVASGCGAAGESVVVTSSGGGLTTPVIATSASPSVALGGVISDTAVLSGGSSPTGKIAFAVFGPNDASCTGTPAFSSMVTVSGNASYSSGPFTPTAAGTYRFTASYGGDGANAAVASGCGAAGESVVVTSSGGGLGTPAITTQATGGAPLGAQLTDTATLSGGTSPTGTVTFRLFGPSDPTCSGTAMFTSAKAIGGALTVTSAPIIVGTPGTYRWVASYGGDASNAPTSASCTDPSESTTITKARPVLSTSTPPSVAAGGASSDTATLAAGIVPTGTLSFALYGPSDTTCTSPIFAASATVSGNGVYTSGPATLTTPGAYSWVVTYGGDANNLPASSPCGSESVAVPVRAPTTPPATTPSTPSGVSAPPPSPGPTITAVCAAVETQVDTQLPGQTIASALAGGFSFQLSAPASIEVRLVLRAKDPSTGLFVSLANFLLHVSTPVTATAPDDGLGANYARRARAFLAASKRAGAPLLVFKVVHCRPDKQLMSAESVAILSLAP